MTTSVVEDPVNSVAIPSLLQYYSSGCSIFQEILRSTGSEGEASIFKLKFFSVLLSELVQKFGREFVVHAVDRVPYADRIGFASGLDP